MKNHSFLRRGVLAFSLGLAALPLWAEDDCDAPVQRWQSREAVRQMAAQQGWQIQRLKIDDGCYEIRGTDSQGRSFKAKIDPETLKVLKIKPQRDRDREHDRERDPAAAPSPLFTPGTASRGQIE
ncbi:MAG: hypothetical protein RIR09_1953 [Pseudomonadota bacterium]|jgi:hypothetical protein